MTTSTKSEEPGTAVRTLDVDPPASSGRRSRPREGAGDTAVVAQLVREAGQGDQRAWNELVDRFAGTVWAIARGHRLSEANAADVSQTTWLRLLENLDRIQQPERVGAWLATTARRESLRVLRTMSRQVPTGEDFEGLAAAEPDHDVGADEAAKARDQIVSELVSRLPSRCQLILRLLSADTPLSYRDLSEALCMPIGSIGPTRGRCLEHLRRLAIREGLTLSDALN